MCIHYKPQDKHMTNMHPYFETGMFVSFQPDVPCLVLQQEI